MRERVLALLIDTFYGETLFSHEDGAFWYFVTTNGVNKQDHKVHMDTGEYRWWIASSGQTGWREDDMVESDIKKLFRESA